MKKRDLDRCRGICLERTQLNPKGKMMEREERSQKGKEGGLKRNKIGMMIFGQIKTGPLV
eukprot:11132417-Karenia_brevis.AAC.1